MNIEDQIGKLQDSYTSSSNPNDKDKRYEELLAKYKIAIERIQKLEGRLNEQANKLPTKEDVDTMSSMLDLINKLDESTIEKLSKFGDKK